jgi:hypothetical protein
LLDCVTLRLFEIETESPGDAFAVDGIGAETFLCATSFGHWQTVEGAWFGIEY